MSPLTSREVPGVGISPSGESCVYAESVRDCPKCAYTAYPPARRPKCPNCQSVLVPRSERKRPEPWEYEEDIEFNRHAVSRGDIRPNRASGDLDLGERRHGSDSSALGRAPIT